MRRVDKYISQLKTIFAAIRDKHEANFRSREVLGEMALDAQVLTDVLAAHLEKKGSLNTLHYPVVGIDIELNEYFGLVANCWIPLPDNRTDVSTKSIHHHGDMLLTTINVFGPGYEHWTFDTPCVVDADKEIYEINLVDREQHGLHHVAFVDSYIAHLPIYPSKLTITFALWSSRFPTNWRDRLKRMPIVQANSSRLRDLAAKIGLAKQLELKIVEYFDFYPTPCGFKGIRERKEFPRTTNDDYLASLFHIFQETGNEGLSSIVRDKLSSGEEIRNRVLIEDYLDRLESGEPIDGKLSPEHFNVNFANFTVSQIEEALNIQDNSGQRAGLASMRN